MTSPNRIYMNFLKTLSISAFCLGVTTLSSYGVMTENVVHEGFAKLDKGDFKNVGITFDGKIFPTQQLTEYATIPASIVWEAVLGENQELIVSTGNNGTVYRVLPDVDPEVVFQPEEALSRALAIDDQGRIYVGTSPKGRVYRILPDGTQEIFFDPQDLYIWDLEIGPDGNLYVATGGRGKIYRIPLTFRMGDEAETLFEASEIHVNKMAFTADGSALIIGCGSGGNLYRLELDGSYYALYHSGAEEIKSIFPQEDGSIYFSTFSSNSGSGKSPSVTPSATGSSGDGDDEEAGNPYLMTVFAKNVPEDNGLMVLDPEGNVQAAWSLSPNKIFSVHQLQDGRWLIGSGTNGRVFRAENFSQWSNILAVPSGGEVTQILPSKSENDTLYLVSSNPARVYKLEAEISEEALYTSEVVDTGKMVDWGTLRYLSVTGDFVNGVEIETRSGNIEDPNRSWSEWQPLVENRIQSPNSRFIQYKIKMFPDNPGLQRIQIYYQEQNLHPTIDEIRIIPGAYGLYVAPKPSQNLNFSKVFQSQSSFSMTTRIPQLVKEKEEGAMTAVWMPGDPNQDRLLFDLFVKKVGDVDWIKIAAELENPIFPMDIRGLEEGYYRLQVVADDKLDNQAEKAIRYAKVSDPFLIDFTSPQVKILNTEATADSYKLTMSVEDKFGVIERAYYVLDGGHMLKAIPTDGMFDSISETFEIAFDHLKPGSYSLVFQGYDENGNIGVITHLFHIP